jgi:hypothetical protein
LERGQKYDLTTLSPEQIKENIFTAFLHPTLSGAELFQDYLKKHLDADLKVLFEYIC